VPMVLPGVLPVVGNTTIPPRGQGHVAYAQVVHTRAAAQQISETRARGAQPVNDATARLW
jgi:hypothetical protein